MPRDSKPLGEPLWVVPSMSAVSGRWRDAVGGLKLTEACAEARQYIGLASHTEQGPSSTSPRRLLIRHADPASQRRSWHAVVRLRRQPSCSFALLLRCCVWHAGCSRCCDAHPHSLPCCASTCATFNLPTACD
jgi:hypothetical protein